MKSKNGQILPLALVLMFVMTLFWVMIINIGMLIKNRIQIQIAADTAVMTECAYQARALNIVGLTNKWLGIPVNGIGIPKGAWWIAPPHPRDASVVKSQLKQVRNGIRAAKSILSSGADGSLSQNVTDLLTGALNGLLGISGVSYDIHDEYAGYQKAFVEAVTTLQTDFLKPYAGGRARTKAREVARAQGADDIYTPTSFSLGLRLDYGAVWYLSTLHVWTPENPYIPIPLPFLPTQDQKQSVEDTRRWYVQGPHFSRKTMRVYAYRQSGSPLNQGFPFGQRLFRISMPDLCAVSAARTYNTQGPMFPDNTLNDGPLAGLPVLHAYDKANPVWQSQLVPVGGLYEH